MDTISPNAMVDPTTDLLRDPEIASALLECLIEGQDGVVVVDASWAIVAANGAFTASFAPGWRERTTSFLSTLSEGARTHLESRATRSELDGRRVDLFHPVEAGTRWVSYSCRSAGRFRVLVGRDQSMQLELADQLSSIGDELLRSLGDPPRTPSAEPALPEATGPAVACPGGLGDAEAASADREGFQRALESCAEARAADGRPFAVLAVDVDRFRQVNDVYGHPTGDLVLERVGQALRDHVRDQDAVARIGGEEFGVILPGLDRPAALEVAERLRSAVEKTRMPAGVCRVTVSIGVAAAAAGEVGSTDDVVEAARGSLQEAKLGGRNCVRGGE